MLNKKIIWALLLLVFAPFIAFAQQDGALNNPAAYEPASSDMTNYMMRSIFGNWREAQSSADVGMLGEAMRVMNLFALTFGTLMFTYIAVIGTLNSAQDGEILGKKWSSMWIPLRFTLGTALLVPLASGYSAAQNVVLWLALVGGGAATEVWNAAITPFTTAQGSVNLELSSEDYINKTKTLARAVLKARTCTAMWEKHGNEIRDPSESLLGAARDAVSAVSDTITGADKVSFGMTAPPRPEPFSDTKLLSQRGAIKVFGGGVFTWGAMKDGGFFSDKSVDSCGSMEMPKLAFQVSDDSDANIGEFGKLSGDSKPSNKGPQATAMANLAIAQYDGIMRIDEALKDVAAGVAANPNNVDELRITTNASIDLAINKAAEDYRRITNGAIADVVALSKSELGEYMTNSGKVGWMMAGSSFFQMARVTSAAREVIGSVPKFEKETPGAVKDRNVKSATETPLYEDLAAIDDRLNESFKGAESDASWYAKPMQKLALNISQWIFIDPAPDKPMALVQIKDAGDNILNVVGLTATGTVALAMKAGVMAGNFAGKGLGSDISFLGSLALIAPAIVTAILSMLAVGIIMSIILPLLPFMMTLGSILGWLMAVFSAVVAAPIWIAGHLHPEGDGFAGKGIGGYMILLETITRPIFIIFGLLGAFLMTDVVLKFAAWTFRSTMASVQGDTITGFIQLFAFIGVYSAICFTTVRTSYSLINSLPQKVYIWIGGANAGYDQADSFNRSAEQSASAAANNSQKPAAALMGTLKDRADEKAKKLEADKAKLAKRNNDEGNAEL